MGWSCSQVAGDKMDKLNALGTTVQVKNVGELFFEWDRQEFDDGSILGEIIQVSSANTCSRVCDFKICGTSGEIKNVKGKKIVMAWLALVSK